MGIDRLFERSGSEPLEYYALRDPSRVLLFMVYQKGCLWMARDCLSDGKRASSFASKEDAFSYCEERLFVRIDEYLMMLRAFLGKSGISQKWKDLEGSSVLKIGETTLAVVTQTYTGSGSDSIWELDDLFTREGMASVSCLHSLEGAKRVMTERIERHLFHTLAVAASLGMRLQ